MENETNEIEEIDEEICEDADEDSDDNYVFEADEEESLVTTFLKNLNKGI